MQLQMQTVRGTRHADVQATPNDAFISPLARPCYCGCQQVAGLPGHIVQDADTPKLAEMGLCIAEFQVPCPAGGPARTMQVAYDIGELRA